jgi:hypothetical protein
MLVTYPVILAGVNSVITDPISRWSMRKLMRAIAAGVRVDYVLTDSGRRAAAMEQSSAHALDANWRGHVSRERSARAYQQHAQPRPFRIVGTLAA